MSQPRLSQLTRPLVRIAGEAELVIFHDGERVVRAHFIATAPVRGFERLCVGKHPAFALEAVMRICGVCFAAHAIAFAEAVEHACGAVPPRDGLLLREAIGLLNRVQSHLLHAVLILPDIIAPREKRKELLTQMLRAIEQINLALTRIGGAPTHSPRIAIGGVTRAPTVRALDESLRAVRNTLKLFETTRESLCDEDSWTERALLAREVRQEVKPLASHLFYGDRYNVRADAVEEVEYAHVRPDAGELATRTTCLVARYAGEFVEVGPRARLMVYRDWADTRAIGLQLARLREIELCLCRLEEILREVNVNAPVRTPVMLRHGRGVGVFEAPRGTLFHFVELDEEGRVRSLRIVVPTQFNVIQIERLAEKLPPQHAEVAARLYDPCIPCSTHLIRVR